MGESRAADPTSPQDPRHRILEVITRAEQRTDDDAPHELLAEALLDLEPADRFAAMRAIVERATPELIAALLPHANGFDALYDEDAP
jgi:hypothetical protein